MPCGHWIRFTSFVPWWLPNEDLCEADHGEVTFVRHTMTESHIALHVVGQFDRGISLGLVAIRCARKGGQLIPLTLSIPDTPMTVEPVEVQSNPRRVPHGYGYTGEDGA